jgi:selenocysteine lyase/cysteine desulfurase
VQFLSDTGRSPADWTTVPVTRRGVVDGIQAVGAVPDVQDLLVDALAAGAQNGRWHLRDGFLYVSEALQERIQQQHVGWLSVASPWEFHNLDQPLAPSARRYEGGTLNIPGMYAMREAITILQEFGLGAIAGQIHGLTHVLMQGLAGIPGIRIITPPTMTTAPG